MLNTVYRLTQPRKIEIAFTEIDLFKPEVVVKPTYLSICHADQRYYQGTRDPKILAQKLPMALIHEGIGEVVYSPVAEFKPGDKVVMIPNTPVEHDDIIAENYLRSSKFRASGFDGFMQEYVQIAPDRLVHLPDGIDPHVAAFTELVSVSVHAISRFDKIAHARRNIIGIWGDGNLSFYDVRLFAQKFLPDSRFLVFGMFLTTQIPEDLRVDHAFECVGGNASQIAINQIIDFINPEGTISILGVSEYPVPINTRMILEKGLRLFGTSRSGKADFHRTVQLYRDWPEIPMYLSRLVGAAVEINAYPDIKTAFETDAKKAFGKTILHWNI